MLKFSDFTGRDIGLFEGFIKYISLKSGAGININNINKVVKISKNGIILTNQKMINKIISEKFSTPESNKKIDENIKRSYSDSNTENITNNMIDDILIK